jgi:hypothetical protein
MPDSAELCAFLPTLLEGLSDYSPVRIYKKLSYLLLNFTVPYSSPRLCANQSPSAIPTTAFADRITASERSAARSIPREKRSQAEVRLLNGAD